ncbi:uncharacterized protein LOC127250813 [Andrographis paniculata]|uniref:uncharacterized protein LOC127250813 n=1 Tax=Andrographis paniculata TaxID=175694 RepID=UPI0021E8853B|nr:uncharacterized protein LOC127250813 [Andrographis paniculata]
MGAGAGTGTGTGAGVYVYLDSVLVPWSVFMALAYHAYLWHHLRHRPFRTTIGLNTWKRRAWLRQLLQGQGDDKKGMLAVQSLRNTLMYAIFTATVTLLLTLSLAALSNNALTFNSSSNSNHSHFFFFLLLGSQSPRILVLKYASASIFMLATFLCTSMAIAFLIDANFLINSVEGEGEGEGQLIMISGGGGHTEAVVERGFALALVGNRMLCIAFLLLLWLFGPVAVAVASAALLWVLYGLDFHPSSSSDHRHHHHHRLLNS